MDSKQWINLSDRIPRARDGDVLLVWHRYGGPMAIRRLSIRRNRFFTHWQPMPADGWIDVKVRRPSIDDGDTWRCVLARNEDDDEFKVTGWHQVKSGGRYTHWMRLPGAPDCFGDRDP